MPSKKDVIYFILTVLTACVLAAVIYCALDAYGSRSSKSAICETEGIFVKPIVPVTYGPDEEVGSEYYKIVTENGKTYYEVQIRDESEPTRIPVSHAVVYGTEDRSCYIKLVSSTRTGENGETYKVPQFQIFARWDLDYFYDEAAAYYRHAAE